MVCTLYEQNACAYRARFAKGGQKAELRVHRDEFSQVMELYRFKQSGTMVSHPTFQQLQERVKN